MLILGGTGFVGPFIVERLVEAGHEVTLFHRGGNEPRQTEAAVHVHGEFARFTDYVPELARRRPEVVVDVSQASARRATEWSTSQASRLAALC